MDSPSHPTFTPGDDITRVQKRPTTLSRRCQLTWVSIWVSIKQMVPIGQSPVTYLFGVTIAALLKRYLVANLCIPET